MNMMHCAAVNDHTDIVAYIVDDLQMKELDKEDHVWHHVLLYYFKMLNNAINERLSKIMYKLRISGCVTFWLLCPASLIF